MNKQGSLERQPDKRRRSVFTGWSIFGPLVVIALGIVMGIAAPHPQSDWFGASVLAPIGLALIVASLLAIVCSVVAYIRKERAAFLSAIIAIPGLMFLLWMVVSIFHL